MKGLLLHLIGDQKALGRFLLLIQVADGVEGAICLEPHFPASSLEFGEAVFQLISHSSPTSMLFFGLAQGIARIRFSLAQLRLLSLSVFQLAGQALSFQTEAELLNILETADQLSIASRLRGLPLKRAQLFLYLAYDVIDAEQILSRQLEANFGSPTAAFISEDTGGLLDHSAAVLRLAGEEGFYSTLGDKGIGGKAESRLFQDVLDVQEPATTLIDQVQALSRAVELATDLESILKQIPCH